MCARNFSPFGDGVLKGFSKVEASGVHKISFYYILRGLTLVPISISTCNSQVVGMSRRQHY